MTDFSLRAIVQDVLASDQSEDLDKVANEVLSRLSADDMRCAVEQMLPAFIHQVLRTAVWNAQQTAASERQPTQPSRKVRGIREAWARHLEAVRYTVENGSSRRLGDLTRPDVLFLAGELSRKARENRERAAGMKALAAAMSEHGAERVRELPADCLREMFAGRAA